MNETLPSGTRFLKRSQRITLYPNLVADRRFWLQLANIERDVFTLYLYTLSNRPVYKVFLLHGDLYSTHTVWLPQKLGRGIYYVAIRIGEIYYQQAIVVR